MRKRRIAGRVLCGLLLAAGATTAVWAQPPQRASSPSWSDRWVWIFGWGLGQDHDVEDISGVLETAARHGLNGACLSCGLDRLEGRPAEYFARLERIQKKAAELRLELIPAAYSVGYGGGFLSHNKHLAEGLPVTGSLYQVRGREAHFAPESPPALANGGFEEFRGHVFAGYRFHDQPGQISFADTSVFHTGRAAIRMENFTANPHGHGRVMQSVTVKPRRAYRFSVWVKTESLDPPKAFKIEVLAGGRSLAPRGFNLKPTQDWQRLDVLVNSLTNATLSLYAGTWGARGGRFWLDDWSFDEVGPVNVLRRPGTPVTVVSVDGVRTYEEGRDFARFEDPSFRPGSFPDRPPLVLRLLDGSRIRDGETLRVSWYHPMVIHDSQVTVCMAEPELYEILDRETKLLGERLHPKRVLLNFDEIRMGGTCMACRGRDMGQLLGECTTRTVQALKRNISGVEVLVWSDMFDPNHNAHGDYYLVEGDFTGSWKHVPKETVMAVWGGGVREKSLAFFEEQGFRTLVACYYDAGNLDAVKGWIEAAKVHKNVRGFMYTPWTKKYELLGGFGDLLGQ